MQAERVNSMTCQRTIGQRTICILSLSAIADDPRVRRQGDAFHAAGWRVVGVGLPEARSKSVDWEILDGRAAPNDAPGNAVASATAATARLARDRPNPDQPQPGGWHLDKPYHPASRLGCATARLPQQGVVRSVLGALPALRPLLRRGRQAVRYLSVRLKPERALDIYWSWPDVRRLWQRGRAVRADVWIANDWIMLPVAAQLADEFGGMVGYDTHEFAISEHEERWKWRVFNRPLVQAIEAMFIPRAKVVSAVSQGIAERLAALYGLADVPMTIMNAPRFQEGAFRPTGDMVRVLYHGILVPGRGLEQAIDSVPLWDRRFSLTLRGPGEADYVRALAARIAERGAADRVAIVPPVPMTALVSEAAGFDIGFFALPSHSLHNSFALPNKLFEYLMAGLALCVSDLPEMARLVRRFDTGTLMADVSPQTIAQAINAMQPDRIDAFKRNALLAARELNWDRLQGDMLQAYQRAFAGQVGRGADKG
jgi:glycosyltransferase involved in cell wall biosynthesis